ncbi:hypothetical protein [Parapedobacter indicus]|uniref:Uncharacterized protein n=1 Tax=Parapedobacter indicus TaxID=1477437 RepID=A0A1I3U9X6_9SPHI|nr:hypothetical protein [Parapedobacter indicus]PPK99177.1 hypothetical protein CLV26_11427 [Parapedobacter indicus]SFJ78656.1 hypothetical protein SAMN05444682_11427 [Parapedobacter indicus]
MKRMKLKPVSMPVQGLYQKSYDEKEHTVLDESMNDALSIRMFENLKMALFFSRIQNQLNDGERQNV